MRYPRWFWAAFGAPGLLWVALFFVIPVYTILAVAMGRPDPIFNDPIPEWNPLQWDVGAFETVVSQFGPGEAFYVVFLRTFAYVAIALVLSLAIGYPVAYFIARHGGRWKTLLLIGLVAPFWISYLMRMLAWVNLLQDEGYVNRALMWLNVIDAPRAWLDGRASTVILGLVYGYIPYLILPLFAALDRIDRSHLEAARDLGASPWSAFRTVTLPLSKIGILGGAVLITLPMFGDYYTPNIVSGTPQTSMIGNQIDLFFHGGPQPTIGAGITVVLALFLTVLMGYYMWTIHRASRDVAAV